MIRFGSRGSQLALAQTRIVGEALLAATGETHGVVVIRTEGDRIQDRSLAGMEGKGFFTKEIEEALLAGRIDAAVHSYKDLPVEETPGLVVGAVPPRADPAECLVVGRAAFDPHAHALPLRVGARVGTSSPRRRAALLHLRPDLVVADLRGNVNTRVERVLAGAHDAILIARAGLLRLALDPGALDPGEGGAVLVPLPPELVTPAAAQGALAVQVRVGDQRTRSLIAALNDPITASEVAAERLLLSLLGGGCSIPLGVLVTSQRKGLRFRMDAVLFAHGSASPLRVRLDGADAAELARAAAKNLLPAIARPLQGKRLLLVRPAWRPDRIADALAAAGAEVSLLPVNRLVPIEPDAAVMGSLDRFRWVAVTSRRSAERLAEVLAPVPAPVPAGPRAASPLARARFAAVGEGTAEALAVAGLCADPLLSESGTAAGLAARLLESGCGPKTPVLFPCALEPRPDLEDRLLAAAVPVTRLPLYRTEAALRRELPFLPANGFDFTLFTSPSGVDAFFALELLPAGRTIAIGPATAGALERAGIVDFRVAATPSPEGILTELLKP